MIGAGKHTAYELPNEYTQCIYKEILNKKFKHSVRDNATKNVLEKMGLKAINTGCPTLWRLNKEHCAKISEKKSDKVIMSVSGHRRHVNREKDQEMINIINNNYSEFYAWIQTTEDENYFDSFYGVSNYKKIYSITEDGNTGEITVDYVYKNETYNDYTEEQLARWVEEAVKDKGLDPNAKKIELIAWQ